MTNYSAWNLTATDFPHQGNIQSQIAFVCKYGILAPSVHNTQPWEFELSGHVLTVRLAQERLLESGDPTRRESWISIGACLENIMTAGRYFGLTVEFTVLPSGDVLLVFEKHEPNLSVLPMIEAIIHRRSSRHSYSSRPVPNGVLAEIQSNEHAGLMILATAKPELLELTADLTGRAIGIALSSPTFRHELSGLIHHSWTTQHVGMPAFTLGVSGPRSIVERRLVHSGALVASQAKKEFLAMRKSGALVLIFSEGDTIPYWINAGRAYQTAALIATKHGLSSATTAAVVEAADFHLDIEELSGTSLRLQSVLRIGYSDQTVKHSPRLCLADVLTYAS